MTNADREALLTPRESEVLDLLHEGLDDERIATRLQISPASARYQISQLIARLGLSSREEAARWTPSVRNEPHGSRVPVVRRLALPRMRLTPLKAVALVVVAFVIGLYAWGIFFDSGDADRGTVEVQWLIADPPAPSVQERARPYASAQLAPGADVWRAYVVEGNGEPRLALESNRLLLGSQWSEDRSQIVLSFSSQTTVGEPLTGRIVIDATTRQVIGERLFQSLTATRPSRNGRTAVVDRRGGSNEMSLYVIEQDGTSRKLSGPWENISAGAWSPDGEWLVVSASMQAGITRDPSQGTDHYAISPGRTKAVFLGRFRAPPTWSPDSKRVAGFEGADLILFDVAKKSEKRITMGEDGDVPLGQLLQGPLWTNDSRYVSHAGAVIDVASGRALTEPEDGVSVSSLSPDANWLAITTSCSGAPRAGREVRNRTVLEERETGRRIDLFDCARPMFSHQWLTAESVLLLGNDCTAGCGSNAQPLYAIANLPSGELRVLATPPFSQGTPFAIAPGSKSVLVGGDSLRVYSDKGSLLRTITVPAGLVAQAVSWSPDGKSFAYTVGPGLSSVFPVAPSP